MQLQEFQAKVLLSQYAIRSPAGAVATTPDDAEMAAARLDADKIFVKAQIHAGERLAAGGIRTVNSAKAAKAAAGELLGQKLVTSQTSPHGLTVKSVLVEAGIKAEQELYLALQIDAVSGTIVVTAGQGGGADIERRLATQALKLESLTLGISGERGPGEIADLARRIGLSGGLADSFGDLIKKLHRAFVELDAGLIEINPLVVTDTGELVAVDAKVVVDDNALYRHPELNELRDDSRTDRIELQAQRHQINFVQMDGDIGTIVNGAGLGLATLDMIAAAGGAPANFMDIRTTAKSLDIAQGIGLVLENPRAKVLLVNVFGGGMQPCDTIAEALGIAFRKSRRILPLVLRMTGNNEDLARLRLANFNLPKTEFADMWQAVTHAVALAHGRTR
ncbi:MAG: acetate--CoA ligase family protein [Xanthobacteraceae bacterium]|nr:acetate--CoA ligase family protein [Xanthobacteraceae bacterium]